MKNIIFVADLHIDVGEVSRLEFFLSFLEKKAKKYDIYIMGDLFNFWAGNAQANLGYVRSFLRGLASLTRNNCIFFLAGNRDFLFVPFFAQRLKGNIIYDGHEILLPDQKIILYHGDALCTGDTDYLKMKEWLQTPFIYYLSRLIPSNICVAIGKKFRNTSQKAIQQKQSSVLGLNDDYMQLLLQQKNADILICGHIHKQQIKTFSVDNKKTHVYVLPECQNNIISYLEYTNHQLSFRQEK